MGAKICTPSPQKLQNELQARVQEQNLEESISVPHNIPNMQDFQDESYQQQDNLNEYIDVELNLPDYDQQLIFKKIPLFPNLDHLSYKRILQKYLVRIQPWASTQANQTLDTKRILAEIKVLKRTLPVEASNSIFVTVNENNMSEMQAIIFGSEGIYFGYSGTPYQNGAFLYTVNLLQTYPNEPPKVNLQTTGNQKIRFNPNLYESGYVCLSLLGTWTGEPKQNWQPGQSNISQVLLSIQTIVMNDDVYYNEPSYEDCDKEESEPYNVAYQNIVRFGNITYAMNDMLENPSPLFAKIIKTHFYLKRNTILEAVQRWIEYEGTVPCYGELVEDHNYTFCERYQRNWVYKNDLIRQYQRLYTNLANIKIEDTLIKDNENLEEMQQKVQKEQVVQPIQIAPKVAQQTKETVETERL